MVLLLNTDVRPLPGLLTTLLRYFGRDDTFSVSPIIKSAKVVVKNFVSKIQLLAMDKVLRIEMGERGRNRVEKFFTKDIAEINLAKYLNHAEL